MVRGIVWHGLTLTVMPHLAYCPTAWTPRTTCGDLTRRICRGPGKGLRMRGIRSRVLMGLVGASLSAVGCTGPSSFAHKSDPPKERKTLLGMAKASPAPEQPTKPSGSPGSMSPAAQASSLAKQPPATNPAKSPPDSSSMQPVSFSTTPGSSATPGPGTPATGTPQSAGKIPESLSRSSIPMPVGLTSETGGANPALPVPAPPSMDVPPLPPPTPSMTPMPIPVPVPTPLPPVKARPTTE